MTISSHKIDQRAQTVYFTRDSLVVDLKDGRSISVPITWYPKLLKATPQERAYWEICGGGYGIHWPEIDEDLSTEGLLRGAPAPKPRLRIKIKKAARRHPTRARSRARSHKKI